MQVTTWNFWQCGTSAENRAAVSRLRRANGAVLIFFLGTEQMLNAGHSRGWGRDAIAVLAGGSFFALLAIGWAIAMRCGDEHRRALLQRSLLWGVGITMAVASLWGFVEVGMPLQVHAPLLAVPVVLALATAVAKVVIFRADRRGQPPLKA